MISIGVAVILTACSSSRDAGPIQRSTSPTTTRSGSSATETTGDTSPATVSSGGATTTSTTASTTSTTATGMITGTAIAGNVGGVEPGAPPFTQTDPFAEAVRLSDGTCVGWADSQGGSTAGLAAGAALTILDAEANEEIGSGTIQSSRWEDMAGGGEQWNCLFDFTATITGSPAEFRVRVGALEPWLARPDPTAPGTFVASVSTDASIGLIPSCPALPAPPSTDPTASSTTAPTTTAVATTAPAQLVSGWNAVGQYWSRGVDSLCRTGLPVTAIARPCRPAGAGSEYITAVVDSDDPTVFYANGAEVPIGTEVTVVVATGRRCG
jgi:hypothetical protein